MSSILKSEPALCPPHKIIRSRSNEEIYRCVQPRCNYYQKREFLEGKEVICSICDLPYIVDAQQLRNAKPRCLNCQDTKQARAIRKGLERLANFAARGEEIPTFEHALTTEDIHKEVEGLLKLEEEKKNG